MENRLHIFYPPFLYATILLFLLGEGTIALDFVRNHIPGYSHSFVITIIMIVTILLGFIKGMNKDITPSMENNQQWWHARNVANNSTDGEYHQLYLLKKQRRTIVQEYHLK